MKSTCYDEMGNEIMDVKPYRVLAGSCHDPWGTQREAFRESCLNSPGVGGISAKVRGTDDEETSQDDEDEVMEENEREEIEND